MKVAMLRYNPVRYDSRVIREARTLADGGHDVRVIATRDGLPGEGWSGPVRILRVDREPSLAKIVRVLLERGPLRAWRPAEDGPTPVAPTAEQPPIFADDVGGVVLGLVRRAYASWRWLKYGRGALHAVAGERIDLYIAHDLEMLPLAVMAKARFGGRILYDSHELFTDRSGPERTVWWRWRWRAIERALIRQADRVITVSEPMARELSRRHGIVPPPVVHNFPDLRSASTPSPTRSLRDVLELPPSSPFVLYMGRLQPGRGLEQLILAAAEYPEIAVALMGDGRAEYISGLRKCACAAGVGPRVHLVPPVDPEQVVPAARAADVGIVAYRDTGLSSRTTLPNKLFEYLAAGLPVVASRLPPVAQVVGEHDVGVTCDPDDPNALAAAIRQVVGERQRHQELRRNALLASKVFNWEQEGQKFLQIIEQLSVPSRG
jgi:glycosyltransferase involved in cell wall biosynthesis